MVMEVMVGHEVGVGIWDFLLENKGMVSYFLP